jgi:3-hydroxyisobutyrate dehydrogenase
MAYRALEQPRIGWIGAGRMGLQMAARLLDTGHDVAIYNRTAAKAAPIVGRGAVAVERPADLADRDVVFTMVSGSDDRLQITTGADGVLIDPGQSPSLLVDFSTVSMDASAAVREAGRKRDTDFASALGAGYRTEDFATLILERARRWGITLAAENVKVDDGLEAL